ncbi:hypothetical protein GQ44DRAFT_649771 [Phaeosphaeriaceae sp. PMI808]|nr:hypothetical protein GQ44DRAFT_649771 [Phaeosphaeriaceae sp. PMI808]
MPDNKGVGWRKKIHGRPKDPQPWKLDADDTTCAEDLTDRYLLGQQHRYHGWRRTIQGSRPTTPASVLPVASTGEDTADIRTERDDFSTLRRESKPKLARYTSLFTNFKDVPKSAEFAEPWSDVAPSFEPYLDPRIALQSIHSHMITYSMSPIPLGYNNGLFRIFEDYHKLRAENCRLQAELQETFQNIEIARVQWRNDERQYGEEIRRLELLIAHGSAGVAGVLSARQNSVIDRKRKQSKSNELFTSKQINEENRVRSHRGKCTKVESFQLGMRYNPTQHAVVLHRPASPSHKMTALSRKFTEDARADLHGGTLPDAKKRHTLSRKVQSELNLSRLCRIDTKKSATNSSSTFGLSEFVVGSHLAGYQGSQSAVNDITVECDVLVAIHKLGELVARQRGLDVAGFTEKLLKLLSAEGIINGENADAQVSGSPPKPKVIEQRYQKAPVIEIIPKGVIRKFQSQPQLCSDKKRHRHFSFEPGEDSLLALEEDLTLDDMSQQHSDLSDSTSTTPGISRSVSIEAFLGPLTSLCQVADHDPHSRSKIPSPIQALGSVRREPSIKSILIQSSDGRHNSQSSILTAFRGDQNRKLCPNSNSRSGSFNNTHSTVKSPFSKVQAGRVQTSNSIVSLKTTKAIAVACPTVSQDGNTAGSSTESSTTDSSLREAHNLGLFKPIHDNELNGGNGWGYTSE